MDIFIFYFLKQASKRNPTTTWSRFTVSSSILSLALEPDGAWVSLEEWQREMLGANCWFIIQTQNLLHHFIGHRESNYIVVQFSTQWLYWGSKSVFMMGKNVLLFYLLLKIKKYRYYNAFWGFSYPQPLLLHEIQWIILAFSFSLIK